MRRLLRAFAFVSATCLAGSALACPSCREAVAAQSVDGPDIAAGFAWSIALMLAMPMGIVATGVIVVLRSQSSPQMAEKLDT